MQPAADPAHPPVIVALDAIGAGRLQGNGVHWSLADNPDLNLNLAHLDPGAEIPRHVNDRLEVAIIVLHGTGRLAIDAETHSLERHSLAVVRRGAERSITAGATGLTYLTVHRCRDPLTIESTGGAHG